ncbi:cytochrome-c peroxidase [Microvirga sp. GCM10011540]|uniref:cytochrome-c peroxidase n=1 Tax=Microvirga sp. GCM10011540 TaxID=3317338 RepID=UPI00361C807B
MRRAATILSLVLLGAGLLAAGLHAASAPAEGWTEEERAIIRSLALNALPPQPADPSNWVADDPRAAVLGRALFFDVRLSANGQVACATCHLPERQFQDDVPLARGVGMTSRRTMPIAGMAHSPFLFWDGRKDSLWSQALGPLESPVEHGGNRTQYARIIAEHYRESYEAVFGPMPDMSHLPPRAGPVADLDAAAAWKAMAETDRYAVNRVFANIGKAIAAFERTVLPTQTRFDAYASALGSSGGAGILTEDEVAGLRLFIGKGECVNCHNGPLLTDNHFHNTGVPAAPGLPEDQGRAAGAKLVREDPFNCLGPYSDAGEGDCSELRFMAADGHELLRAFKTPSLRGAADRPPYMHAGQIATLADVVAHYNAAPAAPAGHSELRPLKLSEAERRQLMAFLATLNPKAEGQSRNGF